MGRPARYHSSEIKAGIWIFISLLILGTFIVGITGAKFWSKMDRYRVHLQYIGGLEVGSPVRLGGMLVGKISQVQLLPNGNELEMTIEIEPGLPVKDNTVAYLSFVSITSEQHLELNPGEEAAALLSPGDLIRSREIIEMSDVLQKFDTMADTVQLILRNVSTILSPLNVARMDSLLEGANAMFKITGPRIEEVLSNLTEVTASLDSMLDNVNRFVSDADSSFKGLVQDTRTMILQANVALARIDTTTLGVGQLLDVNSDKLQEALGNINEASYNLRILSNTVRDNPFLLIRAFPRKERKLPE